MKILMVCLGNICRSPLAEGILKSKIKRENLDWTVDSAGTSSWHIDELPHNGSIAIAKKNGIDITNQRGRQFSIRDFDEFDLILAMDSENYQNIVQLAKDNLQEAKVKLMLNYAHPGSNMAVPDPYYTGDFQEVYDLLELACTNLMAELR
jgi:protein-tyrosine phosphatase